MKATRIALRFPDGTATGFYAWADDPSSTGNNGKPSPVGDLELDAQEILKNASGQAMYFHPGGAFYKDVKNNGQYGQVFASDLKTAPPLSPGGLNGKAAATGNERDLRHHTHAHTDRHVLQAERGERLKRINLLHLRQPRLRQDRRPRGLDIHQLELGAGRRERIPRQHLRRRWNGPALGKRDSLFRSCNVVPIVGYSYGKDNKVNGRVTAFYGLTKSGPGDKGSPIYGWLVQSYQKTGGVLVPCVRRASGTVTASVASSKQADPMTRMALNVCNEASVDAAGITKLVADYSKRYDAATKPFDRIELLTELSRYDVPAMIDLLITTLDRENDPLVREQAIILLGFMRSTNDKLDECLAAFAKRFRGSQNPAERLRIIEVASSVPSLKSVNLISSLRGSTTDRSERFAMAEAIFRLSPRVKVDDVLIRDVTAELQSQACDTADQDARLRAMHILASTSQNNREFLATLRRKEPSPKIRAFLDKAIVPLPIE